MDQMQFARDVAQEIVGDLYAIQRMAWLEDRIETCKKEIELARAAIDRTPKTIAGTERMLAHGDLHRWMAAKIKHEAELAEWRK